jgi:prevent-host-death family protein
LVLDSGSRLLRVQCKWGTLKGEVIDVRVSRSRHTPRGYVVRTYGAQEVDAFAIYCGELDQCYLVPAALVAGQFTLFLRLGATKNKQRASLNWASEFEFTRGAIAQLEERSDGIRKVVGSSPTSSIQGSLRTGEIKVGAHQFRNHFGWYMERAKAGEEFLVTRRGKPYVRLVAASDPG